MFGGTDCAEAEEIKAQTLSSKGRRKFFQVRSPLEQKSERVEAVAVMVLETLTSRTRVSAPLVDIAE